MRMRNCSILILGYSLPSAIVIDNDGVYGKWIDLTFKETFEIDTCRIPRGSPWLNGRCERFHKSIKNEILYRVELTGIDHAMRFCIQYKEYYNKYRPHQSLKGSTPTKYLKDKPSVVDIANFNYQKIPEINGLVVRFEIAA